MKHIEKIHEHWKLNGLLREMLLECRAKEEVSRFDIEGIRVGKNILASTDGHRLVELHVKHNIPQGNYFCTADGFLLDTIEGNFPKYEDIIPDKSKSKIIVDTSTGYGENIIGLILGELCHAGCICKLSFYGQPIKILSEVIDGKCKVYVNKTEPSDHPFMIEAETSIGDFCYVQMPIQVKNQAGE